MRASMRGGWLVVSVLACAACSSGQHGAAVDDGGHPIHDGGVPDYASYDADSNHSFFDASGDSAQTPSDLGNVDLAPNPRCSGAVASPLQPGPSPAAVPFTVASGFTMQKIASIGSARELVALPNGDLLVGTEGTSVALVPNAEGPAAAGKPVTYVTIPDAPVQGITFVHSTCTVYVATQNGVYSIPYSDGDLSGTASKIASLRTGPLATNPDDKHTTSSVAFTNDTLYVAVGSDCNACAEADPDRAAILQMGPAGEVPTLKATRIRNAIALAVNPATGTLWAGGAGQDDLLVNGKDGHPYEYFDAVGLHSGVADYGWPVCEENHVEYVDAGVGACAKTVQPLVELQAYSTIIGAVFYPSDQTGTYAFPAAARGLYLGAHGSWHMTNGKYYTAPRVALVPWGSGDSPKTAVQWDITKVEAPVTGGAGQWSEFVGGYQAANGVDRSGRPTGVAVGVQGSLFIGDDQNGAVYRVRPTH